MDNIQVCEINNKNLNAVWPILIMSIKSADFIGIDLELSGLGDKRNYKNINERYEANVSAAKSRSIISIGITTMRLTKKNNRKKILSYEAQLFNIITLSHCDFIMEPDALKFLVNHSFDFNKLISDGVSYDKTKKENNVLKVLFDEIFSTSAIFCVHNGLVDLLFIYHQFLCLELPKTLDDFIKKLQIIFQRDYLPIVDSKYLSEFRTRMSSSYLQYVFRKCQGDNAIERLNNRISVSVNFNEESLKNFDKEYFNCSLPRGFPFHKIPFDAKNNLCSIFSNFGFCRKKDCTSLHDVDLTIDVERIKQQKLRFRRKKRFSKILPANVSEKQDDLESQWTDAKFDQNYTIDDYNAEKLGFGKTTGVHRSGVDAFMTVFSVIFQQRVGLWKNDSVDEEVINRLPLSGKDNPLTIRKRNASDHGDELSNIIESRKLQRIVIENNLK